MPSLFDTARSDIAPRKPLIKVPKKIRDQAARLITRHKTGFEDFQSAAVILQTDLLACYQAERGAEDLRNHLLIQLAKGASIEPGPLAIRNPLPALRKASLVTREGPHGTLLRRVAAQTRLKRNKDRKPAKLGERTGSRSGEASSVAGA